MSLGEKLKKARIDAGFTQRELEYQTFVTRERLSRWENDHVVPTIFELVTFCQVTGASADEILGLK